jgi:hypothetical protein
MNYYNVAELLQTKCQNLSGTCREFERLNEQGMEKIVESTVCSTEVKLSLLTFCHCPFLHIFIAEGSCILEVDVWY